MRTCYLHLGMPKTGSSSIQSAFFGYEDERLAYAKLKKPNHQMALSTIFSDDPGDFPIFKKMENTEEKVSKRVAGMRQRFEDALETEKDLIFSGEGIIDRLNSDEMGNLINTLNGKFDRVVAIAYIRPLAALVSSQFQERVKLGSLSGFRGFRLPKSGYRDRFEKVLRHAGADNTLFIRFDRDELIDGDIVADFAHRVGATKPLVTGKYTNESLSAEAVGALYAFNKYTAPWLRPKMATLMRRRMREALGGEGSTKFGLGPALIEAHLEKHKDDVAWMEEACGFDVKGEVKPVPHPIETEEQLLRMASA